MVRAGAGTRWVSGGTDKIIRVYDETAPKEPICELAGSLAGRRVRTAGVEHPLSPGVGLIAHTCTMRVCALPLCVRPSTSVPASPPSDACAAASYSRLATSWPGVRTLSGPLQPDHNRPLLALQSRCSGQRRPRWHGNDVGHYRPGQRRGGGDRHAWGARPLRTRAGLLGIFISLHDIAHNGRANP